MLRILHNVYLIHQHTGICLIHRKYGSIEFNQDLVSGFLTALKDFSVEFSKGSGELKVIDMQIFYLLLVFKEGVLITAAADKNDDAKITHRALTDIIDEFVGKFGEQLANWSGDVRIFREFEQIIDNPSLDTFISCSREFTKAIGLYTERVNAALHDLDDSGLNQSSMVMLGDSVFCFCNEEQSKTAIGILTKYWNISQVQVTSISKDGGRLVSW